MRRPPISAAGVLLALIVLACTTARLATPQGETAIGAEAAQQVEAEVGLVDDPALTQYVEAIGARLVERSSEVRRDVEYRFRVVDMVEPNAFALPGGFVYVSRGLLVLLGSEDELANVLGHEIAHVSARHHLRHALRQTPFVPVRLAAGIGAFATSIVSPTLGRAVAVIGSAPGSLYLASHSRGQENEADEIGQKIVAEAGWDPRAMASLMDVLTRAVEMEGEDPNRRSFLDTHPTTPSRERKTLERAATLIAADRSPIAAGRRAFYAKLDGVLVGAPASDGVIVGQEFLHADLDVRVALPEGWKIHNSPHSVVGVPEPADALVAFSIAGEGDDPLAVAREVLGRSRSLRLEAPVEKRSRIGGFPAAQVDATSRAGWTSHYRHRIVWVAHRGVVYQASGTALEGDWLQQRAAIEQSLESFRPLSAADRERVREGRLRVVDAKSGESVAGLVGRVDSAWTPKRTAAANGLESEAALLEAREPVKVAHWEVYVPKPPAQ